MENVQPSKTKHNAFASKDEVLKEANDYAVKALAKALAARGQHDFVADRPVDPAVHLRKALLRFARWRIHSLREKMAMVTSRGYDYSAATFDEQIRKELDLLSEAPPTREQLQPVYPDLNAVVAKLKGAFGSSYQRFLFDETEEGMLRGRLVLRFEDWRVVTPAAMDLGDGWWYCPVALKGAIPCPGARVQVWTGRIVRQSS